MIRSSFGAGVRALKTRPGLAALLFVVHAVLAYMVAAPIGSAFDAAFAGTGYEPTDAWDTALLVDLLRDNQGLMPAVFGLVGLLIPLLFVWASVAGVGLAYALGGNATRPFWTGAARYLWRGLGVTALFLLPMLAWTTGLVVVGGMLAASLNDEVLVFWVTLVAFPALWVAGLAFLDMATDYARIALVSREKGVLGACFAGLGLALRRRAAHAIYLAWFVPAMALILAPTWLEMAAGASFLVFLVQQVLLFGKSAVSVAWIGSEVAFGEAVMPPAEEEESALADETESPAEGAAVASTDVREEPQDPIA